VYRQTYLAYAASHQDRFLHDSRTPGSWAGSLPRSKGYGRTRCLRRCAGGCVGAADDRAYGPYGAPYEPGWAPVQERLEEEENEFDLIGEGKCCEALGVEYMAVPVPDLGVPTDLAFFKRLVGNVVAALQRGNSVAVHCR
jgi:hypothetical protein